GLYYKNSFGTYLHGPILPKNPELADYLIEKAVQRKYGKDVKLKKVDNKWENKAREFVINKL
ncbi:MAG: glutamine amidotransferase, partial [Patescibacteria group bacterium]